MSRIVFAGVVDPNLKKLNICSIRAGLRFLSTRTYINNVHSCSVVHTNTEFYFLQQGGRPVGSGRCLCLRSSSTVNRPKPALIVSQQMIHNSSMMEHPRPFPH
jgi:hypothetical protein